MKIKIDLTFPCHFLHDGRMVSRGDTIEIELHELIGRSEKEGEDGLSKL